MSRSNPLLRFAPHVVAPHEEENVAQALASGHSSGDGAFSVRASAILSNMLGGADVLLTSSCTHALEMSALLLDVAPGDEVVMPSFTFPSTANAFALRGARIRFADVDAETFSMELAQLEEALTPDTKVVVAVHYGGVARDISAIAELCSRRGIRLVEDNAQGLFARTDGRALGTFGELSALSLHQTKNISCGEGGALVVNDRSLLDRALMIREKGTDRTRFLRGEVDKYTWRVVGSSYVLSDVLAAVLVAQLENADRSQARRQAAFAVYRQELEPLVANLGVTLQAIPAACVAPAHVLALLVPQEVDRARLLAKLRQAGVQATSHYEPLHLAPAGRSCSSASLVNTERVARTMVRLPLHAGMSDEDARFAARTMISELSSRGDSR